jgi:hypothetical protein
MSRPITCVALPSFSPYLLDMGAGRNLDRDSSLQWGRIGNEEQAMRVVGLQYQLHFGIVAPILARIGQRLHGLLYLCVAKPPEAARADLRLARLLHILF